MKLEVNEQTVTENCTAGEIQKLNFDQIVCLQDGPGHYLQLWVDEEEPENELYYRVTDGEPLTCIAPSGLTPEMLREMFTQFLTGDQSWAEEFKWELNPGPEHDGVLIESDMMLGEERWEVYPCLFEDDAMAMVVYDHLLSLEMEYVEISQFVGIRVELDSPDESGLATPEEDEIMEAYEEVLAQAMVESGAVYPGHITYEGARHFYFYLDKPATEIEKILAEVNAQQKYQTQFILETDPEKSRYWTELFPPEEGLNLIMDSKLVQSYEEMGDQLAPERLVEFWIDLPTEEAREEFAEWAHKNDFTVSLQETPENEEEPFSVLIGKETSIELTDINGITSQIFAETKRLDGEYEGWECEVVANVQLR